MKKKNEKNFNAFSISVIAVLLVAIMGTGVYAYYQTQVTGTATVTAVNWDFTVDGTTETFSKSFGPLKPGYEGEIDFTLAAENSGVNVSYEITAKYGADSDTITNLKFYTTRTGTEGNYEYSGPITLSKTSAVVKTGTIDAGGSTPEKIYVVWPYGDAASVTADTADAGKGITLDIAIKGTQVHS